MANILVPLCSKGKIAMKDGGSGALARIMLPGYAYGYWFASGQQYTYPNAEIGQDTKMTTGGTYMPNTFVKDYGICLNP